MAPSAVKSPLEQAEAIVDMHKPLVFQILNLNREQYLAWTHVPYAFTGAQKDARLFGPDAMEVFTKTAWWVIPTFWLPIIAYLVWPYAAAAGPVPAAIVMAVGVFIWTFVEYSVHRFLFHVDEVLPSARPLLLVHFLLHGIHHKVPMDRFRLVMPPALSIVLGLGLYAVFSSILLPLGVPVPTFHAAFAGGLVGYVGYDLIHYSEHHVNFPKGSYLADMKKYHLKHHYAGLHHYGYGITSKLWDHVFGTLLVYGDSGGQSTPAAVESSRGSKDL